MIMEEEFKKIDDYLEKVSYDLIKNGNDWIMLVDGTPIRKFINSDKVTANFFKCAVEWEWEMFLEEWDIFTMEEIDLLIDCEGLVRDGMWSLKTDNYTKKWY